MYFYRNLSLAKDVLLKHLCQSIFFNKVGDNSDCAATSVSGQVKSAKPG